MYEVKTGTGDVFYITEEEKLRVLRKRMDAERKARKRNVSAYVKQHRFLGTCMIGLALVCLLLGIFVDASFFGLILVCAFFSAAAFSAKDGDDEWDEL